MSLAASLKRDPRKMEDGIGHGRIIGLERFKNEKKP